MLAGTSPASFNPSARTQAGLAILSLLVLLLLVYYHRHCRYRGWAFRAIRDFSNLGFRVWACRVQVAKGLIGFRFYDIKCLELFGLMGLGDVGFKGHEVYARKRKD